MEKKLLPPVKISRPRHSMLYPRKRLFRLLDRARSSPVIWISAPAGSGKTALVAGYLDAVKLPCLWYQLDEGDGEPATFFYYMGLAVKNLSPSRRKKLPALTPEYLQGLPTFARRYFEKLYTMLPPHCLLVFDNYQNVPDGSPLRLIFPVWTSIIPEGITAVVISRTEPPVEVARLHASEGLYHLRQDDLCLTPEESYGIARQRGMTGQGRLSRKDVSNIHEEVRGWVAGLILMLEDARLRGYSQPYPLSSRDNVFDYFISEIFDKEEPDTRDFLMKTALSPAVTISMAEEMTGNSSAGMILSELVHKNCFITSHGHSEKMFQYHPLFQEFLQARARLAYSPEELSEIRRTAASLLMKRHQVEDAAGLLTGAGDWPSLTALIIEHAPVLVQTGRYQTLKGWIESLPEKLRENNAWLLYWIGICSFPVDPAQACGDCTKAFRLFREMGDPTGIFLAWCGSVDAILLESDDLRQLDPWISLLENLLKEYPEFPSLEIESRVAFSMFKALNFREPTHADIKAWAERTLRLSRKSPDVNFRIEAVTHLIFHDFYSDLSSAPLLLQGLQESLHSSKDVSPLSQVYSEMVLAIYYWMTGHLEMCLKAVARGLDISRTSGVHLMDGMLLGQGVTCSLIDGDLARAGEFLRKMAPIADRGRRIERAFYIWLSSWEALLRGDIPRSRQQIENGLKVGRELGGPSQELLYQWMMAEVLHEQGETQRAAGLLSRIHRTARRMGWLSLEWMCLLAKAHYALDRGDKRGGLMALRRAMGLGRKKGLVSGFGWRHHVMVKLCMEAIEAGIEVEYVQELIRKRNLIPDKPPVHLENWPWPLKIFTLGRFSLIRDGKPVKLSVKAQRKTLDLLKAIIAEGGRDINEISLCLLLWPDATGDLAHQTLKTTLHRLRQIIGTNIIDYQGGRLSLDARTCWVDVWAFERLLGRLENEETGNRDLFDRIIGLYHGPFLGSDNASCALSMRERLHSKFLRSLRNHGRKLCQAIQCEQAIAVYQKGLEVDNLAGEFYRNLMTCHAALGQRAEALAVYQRCRNIHRSILGVEPTSETQLLNQAIRNGTFDATRLNCRRIKK